MDYNPFEKTALHRKDLSKPMRELFSLGLLKGRVLDFGCGHGTDVGLLRENGCDIIGYDKYNVAFNDTQTIKNKYDVVTCNYVFNTIPNALEHTETLSLLRSLSDNVYIAVRSDKRAIKDTWKYDMNSFGYWTSRNSFQRFYNAGMIKFMFGEVEYIINDNRMKLFRLKEK